VRSAGGTGMVLGSKPLVYTLLVEIVATTQPGHGHQVEALVADDTGFLRNYRDGAVRGSRGVVQLNQFGDSQESNCGCYFYALRVCVFFYSFQVLVYFLSAEDWVKYF